MPLSPHAPHYRPKYGVGCRSRQVLTSPQTRRPLPQPRQSGDLARYVAAAARGFYGGGSDRSDGAWGGDDRNRTKTTLLPLLHIRFGRVHRRRFAGYGTMCGHRFFGRDSTSTRPSHGPFTHSLSVPHPTLSLPDLSHSIGRSFH